MIFLDKPSNYQSARLRTQLRKGDSNVSTAATASSSSASVATERNTRGPPNRIRFENDKISATIAAHFPKAVKNTELADSVPEILSQHGFEPETTLLATSLCCDEVNRALERELHKQYRHHFSMGGLAGFAFGGVTSFIAMAHHIPRNGNCLIVYGPHVGIDKVGNIGKVHRTGRKSSGTCCGSAAAAASYVSNVHHGRCCKSNFPTDPLDAQQFYVGPMLLPYARRLDKAPEPAVELPYTLFDAQTELMQRIVQAGCKEVGGDGMIALFGGIQINCGGNGVEDRFLPLSFKIYDNQGQLREYISELE